MGEVDWENGGVRIPLRWEATGQPLLFPRMEAVLEISGGTGASARPVRIRLTGDYRPPLGPIGRIADAAAGRRIAQQSVERFVEAVAERIGELASP